VRRIFEDRASRAIGIGLVALLVAPSMALGGGFREQQSWQFRSPAELQTNLNREALRLQQEQNGKILGGSTSIPLSTGQSGFGGGGGVAGSATTLGNQTNTTTSVTITVTGDNNDIHVDDYLNLQVEQTTERQTSNFGAGR
jgi:hypothetical protein